MEKGYEDRVVGNVLDSYKCSGSVAKVAEELGLSTVKVRKILITHGLWKSRTSEAICNLYALGMPAIAIAEKLGTTVNNVLAYTPYDRGIYLQDERSSDSINSSNYRARKKEIADSQVNAGHSAASTGKPYQPCSSPYSIDEGDVPFVVHIELDFGDDLSPYQEHVLRDYAKCSNGRRITRDIVVPGDFTLYALHYAIQRLYGWQNSHMRRFYLPEDRLNELTDGKLGKLYELDGVLFRFFLENEDGYFINDDYEESQSFISWLREKYTGPYREIADIESYSSQQKLVKGLYREFKTFKLYGEGEPVDVPVRDFPCREMADGSEDDLLFRLPLSMVLAPEGSRLLSASTWKRFIEHHKGENPVFPYVTDKLLYDYDYGDNWNLTITRPDDVSFSDRVFREVVETHAPVCIARDGGMLLDDVGGRDGYIEFIDCVIGKHPSSNYDYDDVDETLEWASSIHGWSRRNRSLENML